jgi:hypothetical protein
VVVSCVQETREERYGDTMEKLNVGVANWFAVAGIDNLHVNNEINTGLIFTNICANIFAFDI